MLPSTIDQPSYTDYYDYYDTYPPTHLDYFSGYTWSYQTITHVDRHTRDNDDNVDLKNFILQTRNLTYMRINL